MLKQQPDVEAGQPAAVTAFGSDVTGALGIRSHTERALGAGAARVCQGHRARAEGRVRLPSGLT